MSLTYSFFSTKNIYSLKLGTYYFILALVFSTFNSFSQVEINTTDPKTTLDVNGALSLRESPTSLAVVSGINSGLRLPGETFYSQYSIVAGPGSILTAFSIDGITSTPIADGQILRLVNTTNAVMTIIHNNTGGEFKIVCPSDSNIIVGGKNSSVTLQYSQSLRKWTVFAYGSKNLNKTTVYGKTNIARQNPDWAPLDGLSITFKPQNEVIYISFNAYGSINGGNADFRLLNGDIEIPFSLTRGANSNGLYQASLSMFPLKVIPGVEITISAEWFRRGIASNRIENNPATNSLHGRYLTIID